MPIRDMDISPPLTGLPYCRRCNRGASGIDGTLAAATGKRLGWIDPFTLLCGDLAFLHDLSSLTLLRHLSQPLIIIVINNPGQGHLPFCPSPTTACRVQAISSAASYVQPSCCALISITRAPVTIAGFERRIVRPENDPSPHALRSGSHGRTINVSAPCAGGPYSRENTVREELAENSLGRQHRTDAAALITSALIYAQEQAHFGRTLVSAAVLLSKPGAYTLTTCSMRRHRCPARSTAFCVPFTMFVAIAALDLHSNRPTVSRCNARTTPGLTLWTALVSAPQMAGVPGFDKVDYGLHPVAVAEWEGFYSSIWQPIRSRLPMPMPRCWTSFRHGVCRSAGGGTHRL